MEFSMELTLDEALQKGIEAHQAGQIENAEQIYTAILKAQPQHPDANHNMAVLAAGVGKIQEALAYFKIALEANPSITQFWLSYINLLIKLDRMPDAKAVFDQAKDKGAKGEAFDHLEKRLSEFSVSESQPQDPNPSSEQLEPIISLYNQGHLQNALSETTQMLERFPNSVVLCSIAGASNAGLMQFDAAIACYKEALKIKPDYAEAYYNMGVALQDKGDPEAAIESYKEAVKIKPDYAEAYNNMGNVLQKKGDSKAAIESYKEALKIKPDYADAHNNMGNTLKDKGDLEAAINNYKQALKIKPDYAEAFYNMGSALQSKGDLETAIECFQKAVKIKPSYAEAHSDLGTALLVTNQIESALVSFDKAISLKKDLNTAISGLGILLLKKGKHSEGLDKLTQSEGSIFFNLKSGLSIRKGSI